MVIDPAALPVPRAQHGAEECDLVAFIAGLARTAAHRGREEWRDHGGRLEDRIDTAMDDFEIALREMAAR